MLKRFIFFAIITLSLASCNRTKKPTAREVMDQKYQEQLLVEQQTVHVTDSLIAAIVPQVNRATSEGFEYEKTEYDDLGRFRPKGMDPGQNVQRTYLRCAVDDYGRTQLICTYCGSKSFVLQQLRIEAADGTSVLTRAIAPNDGSNYSYDIDGTHYQSVTFSFAGKVTEGMTTDSLVIANADTDNGALCFMAQHVADKGLTCWLIPAQGKEQRLNVPQSDLSRFAATYELGVLLRESIRLQQENKTASLKVQYLQDRLSRPHIGEDFHPSTDNVKRPDTENQ